MLPKTYRFTVYNNTGVTTGAITVKAIRKKFSSGALSFEASEATLFNVASLATATYSNGSTIDNSTDLYIYGDFELEVTISAGTPNGDLYLYFQRSTDGTNFDTDGYGDLVAVLNFTATGTKRVTFEL